MTIAVILALLLGSQPAAGDCAPPAQGFYDYSPIYEKFGGFRIYTGERPRVDLGHHVFELEICNIRSSFVCAYGIGFWFAVPRDPRSWTEDWSYKSADYNVIETFDRKIDGRDVKFVVFDLLAFQESIASFPRTRFVYSQEYGLVAVMRVVEPRQNPPGDPVKSPLLFDIDEAVGPGFGRICMADK